MSRNSQMISIKADALKEAIKERGAISALTSQLGVSKQAISNWLSQEKISPSHLKMIVEILDFSDLEITKILSKNKNHNLLFRTSRNTPATDEDREALNTIVDAYLSINENSSFKSSNYSMNISDPSEAAIEFLKHIDMNNESLSLGNLIKKLSAKNIHVLFLDFDKILPRERDKKTSKPRGFCASKSGLSIIAIDSNEKLDDLVWLIIHELAHILLGHLQNPDLELTEERERFCNEIASEAQHPSSFYIKNSSSLKASFKCSNQEMVFAVEDLSENQNSSFMGTILALRRHQIISEGKSKYLFAVNNRRSARQLKISDLFEPTPTGWQEALLMRDLRKYFKAQLFFKRNLLEQLVSLDLCAAVFGITEHEMKELQLLWNEEYAETDPS